ncbi:exodeoxyribonuclease V subunit alpha, partial [uncultured Paraglaciecola sp.]|uniref:exodeoxyribonuclease V subunit alpha n=1 Tax=uncultured Paraglaciecola sp. TaxID=1765024 RepID=UPI002604C7EB
MLMQIQNNLALNAALNQLLNMAKIRAVDVAFADFIYGEESQLDIPARECLTLLAAYLSAQSGEQHSCVAIDELGQPFAGVYVFPELGTLQNYIKNAATFLCFQSVLAEGNKCPVKPIVMDNNQLYLQRYWQYERQLAAIIREKAANIRNLDLVAAQTLLTELFPEQHSSALDWQKISVCIAASQSISFITGGPGTGKTTTVTKLLALLQGLATKQANPLRIQLVAPTGKAAARLTESISNAKQKLPTELQDNLPEQCETIHRLLGAKPQSPYFKANTQHPLHLDVLVVDEASMVDLPLMAKLFAALPENAQIVLLGDQDQLASVETGSVLSDICAASQLHLINSDNSLQGYSENMQSHLAQLVSLERVTDNVPKPSESGPASVIQDNLVRLVKSHRFDEHSGIGQLAKQIKTGQVTQSFDLLTGDHFSDINWYQPLETSQAGVSSEILKTLIIRLLPIYKAYIHAIQQGDLKAAFAYLQQQQVLCAQKNGFWGVTQLNMLIESELHKQGLIDNSKDFYIGRPVMLSKNDHLLKLFNGDIGIVMPDPNNTSLNKVWFETANGEYRGLLPSRLPSLETLYAMTIHKSQGSEFESVYLCLPAITANNQGR